MQVIQALTAVALATLLMAPAARAQQDNEHPDLPPNHSVEPVLVATGLERALGVAVTEKLSVFAPNYRVLGGIGSITQDGAATMIGQLEKLAPVEGATPFAAGLRLDKQERMIIADGGAGRVLRVDKDGSRADVLADRFEGAKLRNVEHVALDRFGNIFFTESSGKLEDKDGRLFVYLIRTQKIALLAKDLAAPSGVAVSPDQTMLYVAERGAKSIVAFKLENEAAQQRRVLITFPKETKGELVGGDFPPLGMACDKKGRLYVCMGEGQVVNVVESPSGRLLRQYSAKGDAADCHFGDVSLYVALPSKEAIFRLPIGVEGFEYSQ